LRGIRNCLLNVIGAAELVCAGVDVLGNISSAKINGQGLLYKTVGVVDSTIE